MEQRSRGKAPAGFILAALVAISQPPSGVWAAPQEAPAQGFAWKDGAEVYKKLCALCHETKTGPTLLGMGHDPLVISYTVRHGSRAMPAFRESEIDDRVLQQLAEYVSQAAADK
jgi:mono/diheme cytochrome c family protein